jgi:ectoine hydroxylase-related dioxygenase (phytanoyl-CoA dioxygenase family)
MEAIKLELEMKGYAIIPNVLSTEEIEIAKKMMYDWQKTIPNHDSMHKKISPHGIYKFHNGGHQRHSWYIRTKPKVQEFFKYLWNTEELIVSYDGSCYISKDNTQKDNIWTHTDQAANSVGFKCYQSFVSLTDNCERTLRVYEGSHKLHQKYFKDRHITGTKNWNLIDKKYLEELEESKRVLNVTAGSLVLWDSRVFHQNQYGKPASEERLVQYICYFPRSHPKNTEAITKKRRKYFEESRTTSHWPCPVHVNSKQPQTYGDTSRLIDYSILPKPNLEDMMDMIETLI